MSVANDWLRSTRRIERTIKSSTATAKRILMSRWFAYKMQNCSKIDTLKDKKWCRFVYVQIIAWMMLSIVMRKVWIDWFRNYERQNANLCTVTAGQLPGHHPFSMRRRQDFCQMLCKNIRPNSRSPNLALCHNISSSSFKLNYKAWLDVKTSFKLKISSLIRFFRVKGLIRFKPLTRRGQSSFHDDQY